MIYNPEIHHRRTIRLKEYDYSQSGAYFVTICAWNKENIFGEIKNGEMLLNEYGEIMEKEWIQTQVVRQYVQIDEYVVMPNHFHGIMVINDRNPVGARRCLARYEMPTNAKQTNDKTGCLARYEMPTKAKQTNDKTGEIHRGKETRTNHGEKETRAPHRAAPTIESGTIGSIIGQFKSIVTKRVNQIRNTPDLSVWQRNYYEHIIRDERELHTIRQYIRCNPLKWDEDEENIDETGRDESRPYM